MHTNQTRLIGGEAACWSSEITCVENVGDFVSSCCEKDLQKRERVSNQIISFVNALHKRSQEWREFHNDKKCWLIYQILQDRTLRTRFTWHILQAVEQKTCLTSPCTRAEALQILVVSAPGQTRTWACHYSFFSASTLRSVSTSAGRFSLGFTLWNPLNVHFILVPWLRNRRFAKDTATFVLPGCVRENAGSVP